MQLRSHVHIAGPAAVRTDAAPEDGREGGAPLLFSQFVYRFPPQYWTAESGTGSTGDDEEAEGAPKVAFSASSADTGSLSSHDAVVAALCSSSAAAPDVVEVVPAYPFFGHSLFDLPMRLGSFLTSTRHQPSANEEAEIASIDILACTDAQTFNAITAWAADQACSSASLSTGRPTVVVYITTTHQPHRWTRLYRECVKLLLRCKWEAAAGSQDEEGDCDGRTRWVESADALLSKFQTFRNCTVLYHVID